LNWLLWVNLVDFDTTPDTTRCAFFKKRLFKDWKVVNFIVHSYSFCFFFEESSLELNLVKNLDGT